MGTALSLPGQGHLPKPDTVDDPRWEIAFGIAACVILDGDPTLFGVNDSKQVDFDDRVSVCRLIMKRARAIAVGVVEPQTIDAFLTELLQDIDSYWTRTFSAADLPEPRAREAFRC